MNPTVRKPHFAIMLTLLCVAGLAANRAEAGVQELLRETQRTTQANGEVSLVWWLPMQFWEESMKANPTLPEAARKQVISTLGEYTIIALMRAKLTTAGLAEIRTKAELQENLRVEANGVVIEPLAPEAVSPAAQMMLSQLKPAIAGMVGQVGQAMEFVVFPAKANGKLLIDVMQPGSLQIKLFDDAHKFRLALGSLMPARFDMKTGEEFPGSYLFNPYTGEKLGTR